MGQIKIGINLEFVRHEDRPFEWGVEKAAEIGYEYVEPMVHWGRELLSEAGYFHSVSMLDDPYRVKRACEKAGVKLSGLSSHCPLCKPEISCEYLKQAVRFAAECGAPVVNTDEGPKPGWTTSAEDHVLMRYVLQEAAVVAEARGYESDWNHTNSTAKHRMASTGFTVWSILLLLVSISIPAMAIWEARIPMSGWNMFSTGSSTFMPKTLRCNNPTPNGEK